MDDCWKLRLSRWAVEEGVLEVLLCCTRRIVQIRRRRLEHGDRMVRGITPLSTLIEE
jgi:hypothetical protein